MSIILGIESTAHTFGIGIVKDGKILTNVREMYTTESGGIVPMDSAKHHKKIAKEVYLRALKEANIKEKQIDAIAFSQGPGLPPCLIEGMKFAKALCQKLDKPLVPVNHCVAHLEIGQIAWEAAYCSVYAKEARAPLRGLKARNSRADPVLLYVSGANTQVIAYASGKYRVFGETLDIGVGNFIDSFARYADMGFPGGPKIEKLAEQGDVLIELPYRVKGMDIALSGILTNLKQKLESKSPKDTQMAQEPALAGDSGELKYKLEDLAFSLQETVFAMLVETAERALAHVDKKELLLGGGVACNKRLVEMCKIMCKERGAKLFVPEKPLLVDNGAMIAYLGEIMFKSGIKYFPVELGKLDIKPRQRTDGVLVSWR